jgi:hypothetical protein
MSNLQNFAMLMVAVLATVVVLPVAFEVKTEVLLGILTVGIVTAFLETRPDQ